MRPFNSTTKGMRQGSRPSALKWTTQSFVIKNKMPLRVVSTRLWWSSTLLMRLIKALTFRRFRVWVPCNHSKTKARFSPISRVQERLLTMILLRESSPRNRQAELSSFQVDARPILAPIHHQISTRSSKLWKCILKPLTGKTSRRWSSCLSEIILTFKIRIRPQVCKPSS